MDELEKLVEQVKILAATVETMISRQDQLLKALAEQSNLLHQSVDDLKIAREHQETVSEALTDALSDVDSQVDDLAKVTAALTLIQQRQAGES